MSEPRAGMTDETTGETPAIALVGVDIGYGGEPVVRGVSLEVRAREVHVLLGESGSGKTTILRTIAGFESVSRGRIELFGELVDQAPRGRAYRPPEKRGVGVVFQDYALFPHLDVARNVGFGMARKDARAVAELLERVGLGGMGTRHVSELSGGQQQRVALARALAQDPRIILCDEPFSNLDRGLRDELRRSTADIVRARGVTAVFVTHDRHEAFALADRISVIGDGRILQTGSCREIYERPVSEEVAQSVGETVVLASRVDSTGERARCSLGDVPLGARATPDTERRILLRPEQLELEPVTAAPEGAALGTVERVTYFGHADEVCVRMGDDTYLSAHARPGRFHVGERVRLCVRGSAVCV